MSFTDDLVVGVAELLHDAGIGVWAPQRDYTPDEVGIYLGRLPQAPDEAIALAPYLADDQVEVAVSVLGVQIRYRGPDQPDPGPVWARADDAFDVLHAAEHLRFGSWHVASIRRVAVAELDDDDNGRPQRADSYYLTADRPSPHRTDVPQS